MEELQQNMPSNSKKSNKQQQQQISKDMKELSKKMQDMFNQMNMQALNMNMQDLRQLIDNLTTFSFNQEDNYERLSRNFTNSPQFPDIISNQDKDKKRL
jgi:ABC-type transporter Mla subunit MlaD